MTLNIIGKIDATRHFDIAKYTLTVPLNEAIAVTDSEYRNFKNQIQMNDNKAYKLLDANYVEREKENNFQKVFKELWPNLHNRLNEPKQPTCQTTFKLCEPIHNYFEKQANGCNHVCSDCIAKKNSCSCNNEQKKNPQYQSWDKLFKYKSNEAKIKSDSIYPNVVSSYDLPYSTTKYTSELVKNSYNPDKLYEEVKILKSIKESNEKLRMQNKIDTTTDIVDDIINKVNVLQNELKKKSLEVKIKEDIIKMENEVLKDLKQQSHKHRQITHHQHRHHHHHKSRSKSNSRKRYSQSPSDFHLTSSNERKSSSSPYHYRIPESETKKHSHHHHHHHCEKKAVKIGRAQSALEKHSHPKSTCYTFPQPKVDSCWY